MLFLAVFCGFLAEYQLEHIIEKDKEKQFMRSMVTDLQEDVNSLQVLIENERKSKSLLDTLIQLLTHPEQAKQRGDELYYTARLGPRSAPFANNSRTFDQLKNSGGFRLIRKADASNRIMDYYNLFLLTRLLENNYNQEFTTYKAVAAKILDPLILRRQETDSGSIVISHDNPQLLTYDRRSLDELAFHVIQMNGSRRGKMSQLNDLYQRAEKLITFLKEKYRLE